MRHKTLAASKRKAIKNRISKKTKIIHRAVTDMEAAMKDIVDRIIEAGFVSGEFFQPSLHAIDVISDRFYTGVVADAFHSCQEEKKIILPKKKTLAKGPKGIPRGLKDLREIFHDKKNFQSIMKRSEKMSSRLKKAYLKKLREKFDKIMPLLTQGMISREEAKKEMLHAWHASKARVETIFTTETTNYFSKVQTQFFKDDEDIIGFEFVSDMRATTTKICRSRHGMIFTKDHKGKASLAYNTPALHHNCGSELLPLANTPENRKLLSDSSRDPSKNFLEPLPKGWR